jgi:phosphinothricin acetyltransferase
MQAIGIEPASSHDLDAIAAVYHHYVFTTAHTFDVEARPTAWWQDWFSRFAENGRHRLFVARAGVDLLGYAASDRFRERPAYDPSVTTSVYVAPDHVGRGVGTALYRTLFAALEGVDVHMAYAGIVMPNPASVRLHEKLGFDRVGSFSEQGRKFGRYWDVAWYERRV